ncbi:sperm acrosome membrane-associated protein 4-like [Pseudoliparis swirei]|uniref:sperm acrosome membrane-associated protein 4-like n=1 Tax=Pseudoliparis swirei TaxID=2059687 RepID=UPI0024BDC0AC|nr:sperm acrosome membrane-associated protein 4-like [Pseudoliparis swirei]
MNNFWKAAIILGAFLATAQCLTCRQCPVAIFGTCLFGSDVQCNNATKSCYRGEAQFNATGTLKLQIRGCLDTDLCEKTLTGSFLGAGYTSKFNCCSGNLCNGVPSVQLSLTVALGAAILSFLI